MNSKRCRRSASIGTKSFKSWSTCCKTPNTPANKTVLTTEGSWCESHKNGKSGVRIQVADNGIGIPAENLTKIFSHGFTTRKDGHGFGLHSGALAAQELGGTLTVFSDGPGKGATFTLDLSATPTPPQRRIEKELLTIGD